MTKITKLEDARVLKRMGASLNMPIVDRTFSAEYSKHWTGLMNAEAEFMFAMLTFITENQRPGKWKLAKRGFAGLGKAMQQCDAFIGGLVGGEEMTRVKDGTASEQEQHEAQAMGCFLVERAMPFAAFWQDLIDTAEGGDGITFNASDIPPWLDDE